MPLNYKIKLRKSKIEKVSKIFLLFSFTALVFGAGILNANAESYAEHSVTLFPSESGMISETVYEEEEFNAVAVQAEEELPGLEVNFGSVWRKVHIHDHGYGPEALLATSPAHTIRFRMSEVLDAPVTLKAHIFYYEPEKDSDMQGDKSAGQMVAKSFTVIKRSEWGADENIRYWNPDWDTGSSSTAGASVDPCSSVNLSGSEADNILRIRDRSPQGDLLLWPLQYMKKVHKIIIHHTDSEIRDMNGDSRMDNRDYKALIRAIYQYHAVTRGWGDIGYNYLIDPLGNIYEGRYGGDKVIGAHAQCYNNGTLGISIIGDYGEKNLSEPALNALISLIAKKAAQFGINPTGVSVFRGKKLPNIIGHRDVRATSCPGQKLYDTLVFIRERAALAIRSGAFKEGGLEVENLDYNAELVTDISTIELDPNERKTVRLTFKNTGKKTWDNNTWLHVALNNSPEARIVPIIEDKVFVAADMEQDSVSPGQSGSFDVELEGGYFDGDHYFEVAPVVNGRYKVSRASAIIHMAIKKPDFSYEVVGREYPKNIIFQGQKIEATIDLKNTGNVVWKNYGGNQITLGTSGPRDRKSIFIKENPSRLGYLVESEVAPGSVGHFVMSLEVPEEKTGLVIEQFIPVIEGVIWLQDKALGFKATIKKPVHLARIKKLNSVSEMLPGEMVRVELEMENRGDLAWDAENMQTTLLGRGMKVFKNRLIPDDPVEPGKKGIFSFWMQAPYTEGRPSVFLRSKFNKTPIRGGAARYVISVPRPSLRAQLADQSDRNITMRPREEKELMVQFKNIGNAVWRNSGANAVYLGTSRPQDRLSRLYYKDGWESKYRAAVLEEDEVKPGETGTFIFRIRPENKGVYNEYFQLVMEGVGWIDNSYAKWSLRVFGDPVSYSSSSSSIDSKLNKQRASIITKSLAVSTSEDTTITKSDTVKTVEKTLPKLPSVSSETKEEPFRVRLSYFGSSSEVTADSNFEVTDGNGKTLFKLSAGETVMLRRINNNIHVQVENTVKSSSVIRLVPQNGGVMEILSMERRPSWNQKLNDNRFRGTIEVRTITGQTAFINELPLEDYLKGLAEVSNDTPYEKQKVIAVLARSYARFYMKDENRKFPGLPYDGSDDPDIFQRYLGYGFELRSPNFLKAVAATEGEVVTYNGELVKTPYFNQSSGRTLSAEEVWGWTNTPYLKSVPDPWCEGLTQSGHGVGLSGLGATKQAEEGKGYKEIIKYYYDGVEVEVEE